MRRQAAAASMSEGGVLERILDSAETVLRKSGYVGFTTRRVAEEAGIAIGNLTYHFPTKPELVRELIHRLVTRYLDRFDQELRASDQGLESLVEWLLTQAADEDASSIFRELWAMARHDEIVRAAVDDFYDTMMARVADTLQATHPDADPRGVADLVQMIAVISEGTTVLYGTRSERISAHSRMVELTKRLIPAISPQLARGRAFAGEGLQGDCVD